MPARDSAGEVRASPAATLRMQRIAGNRATMRWLARSGRLLQRELSWHEQRVEWIRAALRDENWDGSDPPGAYYIFNGLSKDDMIWIYGKLTASERKKLEDNLDKTNLDRARMYQGIQQAKAGGTWWREKSEAVHWAIRQGDFTSFPGGAYWIINPLQNSDRAKIMSFLDRDHLDELIGHEDEAVTAGVPNARDIAGKARAARSGRGAKDVEKRIAKLIPDSHPVSYGGGTRTVDLPEINADVHEAFKALIALNDFDLLRTLRSLGPDKRLVLLMNIKQLDELGVDSSRIRRSLLRADQDRKDLTALSITTGDWEPYYKKPSNDYSRTLQLHHPTAPVGNAWQIDLGMDEIKDREMPLEQAQQLWESSRTKVGKGGLLWPDELNKTTVPNLWAIKEEARKRYSDRHAEDELFIITAFMAVEGLLHAGASFSGGPGLVTTTRTTRGLRSGGGPFGTGGRLPAAAPGEPGAAIGPPPAAAARGRALVAEKVANGETVVVNLGGAGAKHEPPGAINVNNQAVARKNIPNLVEADGSDMGSLFEPSSVDRIEGHNMAPGVIDWKRGAPGAYRALKSGGKFSYAYRGGNDDARVLEQALKDAGFNDVKNIQDAVVIAVKP